MCAILLVEKMASNRIDWASCQSVISSCYLSLLCGSYRRTIVRLSSLVVLVFSALNSLAIALERPCFHGAPAAVARVLVLTKYRQSSSGKVVHSM